MHRHAFCAAMLLVALTPLTSNAEAAPDRTPPEGTTALGEPHLPLARAKSADAAKRAKVTRPTAEFSSPEMFEGNPGGASTKQPPFGRQPFSHPSPKLTGETALAFTLGEALFEKLWVVAPSSTISSDGLGPLYNARACSACHVQDGRGLPPQTPQDATPGLMLRLSVPGAVDKAPFASEPTYGAQLQDRAITGHAAEAKMMVHYSVEPVELGDGTVVELRNPTYEITDLTHGKMAEADDLAAHCAADDWPWATGSDSRSRYPCPCRSG